MSIKITVSDEYFDFLAGKASSSLLLVNKNRYKRMINVGKFLNNQEFPNIELLCKMLSILYNPGEEPNIDIVHYTGGYKKQQLNKIVVYEIIYGNFISVASMIMIGQSSVGFGAPLSDEFKIFLMDGEEE